ncbi:MAG: GIY-YIG nuclease family protein [Bacteroidetes bacterium]|nr:GIY-YIG nuclease family protein [Bacteroidota bacterium]
MKYYAYVLFSRKYNKYYKGHCQNLDQRLSEHNTGKTKSIKPFIPWEIIYYESFNTLEGAIKREKYFKSGAGRRFLKKKIDTSSPPA